MELRIANAPSCPGIPEQTLGVQVGHGSIVLMDATEQDPIGGRPRCFGESGSPTVVGVVADLAPVDSDDHNWSVRAKQHDPLREERVGNR